MLKVKPMASDSISKADTHMNECKFYIQYTEAAICNCNNIYMHAGIWHLSVSVSSI